MSYETYTTSLEPAFYAPLNFHSFDFEVTDVVDFEHSTQTLDPVEGSFPSGEPVVFNGGDSVYIDDYIDGFLFAHREQFESTAPSLTFWIEIDEHEESGGFYSGVITLGDGTDGLSVEVSAVDDESATLDIFVGSSKEISETISLQEPIMVTVEHDGTNVILYVNGTSVAQVAVSYTPPLSDGLLIGSSLTGASDGQDTARYRIGHVSFYDGFSGDLENIYELGGLGYIIETIDGPMLSISDMGATGISADWHIVSI